MPAYCEQLESPWPHRLAVALVGVVFPLLWVGGLVTTFDAGMAVPDWPGTYGYNLFLYPVSTWLAAPFDLFVEHGHRLLGATAGLLCIALVTVAVLGKAPSAVRVLAAWALGLVIVQGVLGGTRVLLNDRTLAMLHGCLGPLFFALVCALAVVSSPAWRSALRQATPGARRLQVHAAGCGILAYAQLVLGAQLRHVPVSATPDQFRILVALHLFGAAAVTLAVLATAGHALLCFRAPRVRVWAAVLALLVACQLVLGGATWLAKYGWVGSEWSAASIVNNGLAQSLTVTLHVACGALVVAAAVVLSLWSMRLVCEPPTAAANLSPAAAPAGANIQTSESSDRRTRSAAPGLCEGVPA